MLLLTGFAGQRRWGVLSKWGQRLEESLLGAPRAFERRLLREAARSKDQRHRESTSVGCYLVYQAEGELLVPPDLAVARRLGGIGFGFDLIDGKTYRNHHRRAVHSTVTALSLALTGGNSPEIRFLTDVVYLTGSDSRVIYSKTIKMGAVGVMTSGPDFREAVTKAAALTPALIHDAKLDGAVDLFVRSQRKSYDNLRAFIAAWSGLELLINRLCKVYWEEFQSLLASGTVLPPWDIPLQGVAASDYRMRDRFYCVALVLFDPASTEQDTAEFAAVNRARNHYYHEGTVDESGLPTQQVQALFRKYLKHALKKGAGERT
jgi:hypothetical protein